MKKQMEVDSVMDKPQKVYLHRGDRILYISLKILSVVSVVLMCIVMPNIFGNGSVHDYIVGAVLGAISVAFLICLMEMIDTSGGLDYVLFEYGRIVKNYDDGTPRIVINTLLPVYYKIVTVTERSKHKTVYVGDFIIFSNNPITAYNPPTRSSLAMLESEVIQHKDHFMLEYGFLKKHADISAWVRMAGHTQTDTYAETIIEKEEKPANAKLHGRKTIVYEPRKSYYSYILIAMIEEVYIILCARVSIRVKLLLTAGAILFDIGLFVAIEHRRIIRIEFSESKITVADRNGKVYLENFWEEIGEIRYYPEKKGKNDKNVCLLVKAGHENDGIPNEAYAAESMLCNNDLRRVENDADAIKEFRALPMFGVLLTRAQYERINLWWEASIKPQSPD